jgi:Family 4 glycosyl hydrolase/Family 4 glycosyl hydrolase C-terminal domain
MRALRTIPVLLDLCREIEELAPEAHLLQYVNPMAMNCWAVARETSVKSVGLCHSVHGTAKQLAVDLDVPIDEIDYLAAGINHMAFYLRFSRGGEDLDPRLHEVAPPDWNRVRYEVLKHFGWSAPSTAARRSVVAVTFGRASSAAATRCAAASDVRRRSSSMSMSAISDSASSGYESTSPIRFFAKTTEPAPMNAIFAIAMHATHPCTFTKVYALLLGLERRVPRNAARARQRPCPGGVHDTEPPDPATRISR